MTYRSWKCISRVQEFIVKKVAAIILTPADSKAVGTAIKEANEAGIPVFTADIASLAKDATVVCHVATDNYSGGRQVAEDAQIVRSLLARKLNRKRPCH